jgi:hypothetical protein
MATQYIEKGTSTAQIRDLPNAAGIRIINGEPYYHDGVAARKMLDTQDDILPPITTDAADAAISVLRSGIVVFTKGSASAHVLPAPTFLTQRLQLAAGSAFAHVITATGLIDDGVTGGSKTTLTLGSFIGAMVTLLCVQAGKWMVESKNVCTIT